MGLAAKLLAGIVLLGALVFFHELGHFLVAKLFRVKVLKFSLGFGPRVWGFRRGETEYQLAALPLGGYVKMSGEDPSAEVSPEDRGRGFSEQKPYKRLLIALAGPAVNLLLPPLVFFGMNLVPQAKEPAIVGVVLPGEPGEAAGLLPGDRVVAVDGMPVRSFEELREAVEQRAGKTVPLLVDRDGAQQALSITPVAETDKNPVETTRKGRIGIVGPKLPPYAGVVPGSRADVGGVRTFDRVLQVNGTPVRSTTELDAQLRRAGDAALTLVVSRAPQIDLPSAPASAVKVETLRIAAGNMPVGIVRADLFVRALEAGAPAAEAGLQPLDRIVQVNGEPVLSLPKLQRLLEERFDSGKDRSLTLTVERAGGLVQLPAFSPKNTVRDDPLMGKVTEPTLGFSFDPRVFTAEPWSKDEMVMVNYPPLQALERGVNQTVQVTRGMVLAIGGLVVGRIPARSVGGPIMIFQLAGDSAARGIAEFLKLFAIISINLGLMNLLPVPALDGFHILVAGVEGISRRPLPMKVRVAANYVGLAMLLALMVLAFKNDLVRTFGQY